MVRFKWFRRHINHMNPPLLTVGKVPFSRKWCQFCALSLFSMISIWIFFQMSPYLIPFGGYIQYTYNFPNLSGLLDVDCDAIFSGNKSVLNSYKKKQFNVSAIEEQLEKSENKCKTINKLFSFILQPLSREEEEFPLAYGTLVYKNIVQVLFMLSGFYHPQNLYCIAVSGSADSSFKRMIHYLPSCFSNIYILDRPPIKWGSFEIINSTYSCMESLSRRDHGWKYFQYLSGVDIPLKSNLEMVKILKQFGGNVNAEFSKFQVVRTVTKNTTKPPLPLFKSSLSAVIPRKAADFLVSSPVTQQLLDFLNGTEIPDESFWGTLFGNVKDFPVPGAINAKEFIKIQQQKIKSQNISQANRVKWSYYISREQTWQPHICHGKMVASSCVYGIQDIPRLLQQPTMVAHKLYLDFQPVGFFCALKEIRRRTLHPVPFDVSAYSELPQYELLRGISPDNLTHPSWLRLE